MDSFLKNNLGRHEQIENYGVVICFVIYFKLWTLSCVDMLGMPVVPALERLRQEEHELEASLCYAMRHCYKK
jgi:hypothetical protein